MTVSKKEADDVPSQSECTGKCTQASARSVVLDFPLIIYTILSIFLALIFVAPYYLGNATTPVPAPAQTLELLSSEDAARGYLCVAYAISFGILMVAIDKVIKTCLGHRAEMKKAKKEEWLEGRRIGINERKAALTERKFYLDYEAQASPRAPIAGNVPRWYDLPPIRICGPSQETLTSKYCP